MKSSIKSILTIAFIAGSGFFFAQPAIAGSNVSTFHVNLDTSALFESTQAPFYLEFQFTDGSSTNDANNTIMLSNFNFGGGAPVGLPEFSGGASGSLGLSISLVDSDFFNDFYQQFTPGTSLDFDVEMTTFVDDGGTPDLFTMSILDKAFTPIQTSDPGNAFLSVNFDSSEPLVNTYEGSLSGTPIEPANITVAAVPEISTTGFAVALLGSLAFSRAGLRRHMTASA